MRDSPLDPHSRTRSFIPAWLVWALVVISALALLWPLYHGRDLRGMAAQRRLDQGWHPKYSLLPILGLAHNKSLATGGALPARELDKLRGHIEQYEGTFVTHFWLELAWLEARAGRMYHARQALARARKDNPRIYGHLIAARIWDPFRGQLGLVQP